MTTREIEVNCIKCCFFCDKALPTGYRAPFCGSRHRRLWKTQQKKDGLPAQWKNSSQFQQAVLDFAKGEWNKVEFWPASVWIALGGSGNSRMKATERKMLIKASKEDSSIDVTEAMQVLESARRHQWDNQETPLPVFGPGSESI